MQLTLTKGDAMPAEKPPLTNPHILALWIKIENHHHNNNDYFPAEGYKF